MNIKYFLFRPSIKITSSIREICVKKSLSFRNIVFERHTVAYLKCKLVVCVYKYIKNCRDGHKIYLHFFIIRELGKYHLERQI
jgi:hypothetical protein